MAINFLDNVQFNQNQLLGARLENVTSDPTSASGGDIIFNSTTGKFKYYDGTNPFNASGWIDPALGGVSGSGTIGTIPIFVTNTTTLGDSNLTVSGTGGSATLDIGYPFLYLKTLTVQGDLKDVNDQTGTAGQLLSSLGSGNGIDWINAPVSYTGWDVNDGFGNGPFTIGDGDEVSFNGSGAVTATASTVAGGAQVEFALKTNVSIVGDLTVGGGDITLSGTGRIQGVDTVTASTDAASKAYVDSSVAGGLTVKGGFNASTGITAVAGTNLYTNTTIAVGDYYTVTVAGNFFGQTSTPLTPGDSVLVQTAAASGSASITDFAVIQSDTDLATQTTVGIGNVTNDAASSNGRGLQVSYSSGTATVSLDIKSAFPALPQAVGGADNLIIWDGTSGNQGNYVVGASKIADFGNQANTFYGTTTNQTTHTFNHNLGTTAIIVQLWDGATKQVVYATTEYTSTNQVVVTTSSSASLSCAVQKMN